MTLILTETDLILAETDALLTRADQVLTMIFVNISKAGLCGHFNIYAYLKF